jgi:hypothetical protein
MYSLSVEEVMLLLRCTDVICQQFLFTSHIQNKFLTTILSYHGVVFYVPHNFDWRFVSLLHGACFFT